MPISTSRLFQGGFPQHQSSCLRVLRPSLVSWLPLHTDLLNTETLCAETLTNPSAGRSSTIGQSDKRFPGKNRSGPSTLPPCERGRRLGEHRKVSWTHTSAADTVTSGAGLRSKGLSLPPTCRQALPRLRTNECGPGSSANAAASCKTIVAPRASTITSREVDAPSA